MASTLRVMIVPPMAPPRVTFVPHTLAGLQACVGGNLECWAIDGRVALFCHESGRLLGLPYNRRLTLDDGTTEAFRGPLLLAGNHPDTGESESLTDADIARWTHRLLHPAHPEIRHRVHFQRYTTYGRSTTVTLQFDANGQLTPASARTWARSVARDWGSINQETRFTVPGFNGWIYWFSCAGHGGYVVVTADAPRHWKRFAWEGAACHSDPAAFHGTTLYAFEEDCHWAALEASLPALADQAVRRTLAERARSAWLSPTAREEAQQTLRDPARYAAHLAAHQAAIERTLARYLPDWSVPTEAPGA